MNKLTFKELREANVARNNKWQPKGVMGWSLSDWGVAMGGECGEALDVIKKLNRIRDGIKRTDITEEELLKELEKELADLVTYADLLAERAGIDLGNAITSKFNEVSDKYGFEEKL